MSDNGHNSEDWRDWARWAAEGRATGRRIGADADTIRHCEYPGGSDAAWFFGLGVRHVKENNKIRDRLVRSAQTKGKHRLDKARKDELKGRPRRRLAS